MAAKKVTKKVVKDTSSVKEVVQVTEKKWKGKMVVINNEYVPDPNELNPGVFSSKA